LETDSGFFLTSRWSGLTLSLWNAWGGAVVKELGRRIDEGALSAFRERFAGDVVLPTDEGYEDARSVWNAMIVRRPALVARCTAVADVVQALGFARDQDLVIAVRSGGHSVGGFSTCDDGIVIDLSGMRGVSVDPDGRLARVNGGALLKELDHEAQAFGLACPVGPSPTRVWQV
jgi:FAD/FMN-containing dehydrogenase